MAETIFAESARSPAISPGMGLAGRRSVRPSPLFILLVFLVAQLSDGLLTYTAVGVLDVVEEGNLLLAAVIEAIGAGPALLGAKALASAGGFLLYLRGCHGTLGALTAFYFAAAIGPWLTVFHNL